MKSRGVPACVVLVSVLASALAPGAAGGQTPPTPTPQGSGDVSTAAQAFQQGQSAQLAGQFGRAAEFFELADRAAPSPAALRSAIRNHQAAGHTARAATLALIARARDGADAQSEQLADATLGELTARLGRVRMRCDQPCAAVVDHQAVAAPAGVAPEFFVEPGAHVVEASWPDRGNRSHAITAVAGQTVEVAFEMPPAPVAPVTPPEQSNANPQGASAGTPGGTTAPPLPPPARRPLPPVVFWVGLAATAAAGAVLGWSGVDTLNARDAYVATPTESGYTHGVGLETRTNALVGTVAVLGVATAVTGLFFTDWTKPGRESARGVTAPLFSTDGGRVVFGVIRSF